MNVKKVTHSILTSGIFFISFLFINGCEVPTLDDIKDTEEPVTNPSTPSTPATPGGNTTPTPLLGYDLELEQGDFWTFYWDWSDKATWVSSYDSNTDNETGSGYLTITLGESSIIGGKTLYRTILSGDIPIRFTNNPFWAYLGCDDGSLIASDGFTVSTIVDGQSGTSSNSFFKRYAMTSANALHIAPSSFSTTTPVAWSTSTDSASYSSGYDDTIVVPGYDPISGDEYTRTIGEHYKKGIGPVGCSDYEYLYDKESGSSWTTYITKWNYSLVKTSLAATDGFTLPALIWEIAGSMPATMEDPSAVLLDGSVYLLGGGSLSSGQRTVWKQGLDGTWLQRASLPTEFSGLYGFGTACAFGGKIYFFCEAKPSYKTTAYSYSPDTNTWATESSVTSFYPSASIVNGDTILCIGKSGWLQSYNPATKVFTSIGDIDTKYTYISMTRDYNSIYTVGQWNSSGDTYTTGMWTCGSSGWAQKYISGVSTRRWKPGLAVYNGRLYIFGGNGKDVISCAISDGATSDWKTHTSMLYGGPSLSAIVRGDEIYVYGVNKGTSIEKYSPESD